MDFINKAWTQIADVFKSLTPGTRIAVGLLAAAVVVGLFYLFQYQATGSNEFLLGGRPFVAEELTKAEAAFAKAGLSHWEVVEGSRIRVPHGKKSLYLAALGDGNALPADFYNYLDAAANSDNPFASNKSLDFKRSNAKQKELALIISRMRGIASATVHFDQVEKSGLRGDKSRTAMVAVKPLGKELDADQVKAIRTIVASAYAGLDKNSISITDMNSGLVYGGGADGAVAGEESPFIMAKIAAEKTYKQKISNHLKHIPNAIVDVNVELSPELQTTTQEVKIDTKPIAIESSESNVEKITKGGTPGGRPGAASNGVTGNSPLALTQEGSESTSTESTSKQKNQAGHTVVTSTKPGLIPTKVTASIQVPASHYVNIWKSRNPVVAGQPAKEPDLAQIDQIKQIVVKGIEDGVRNLLPPVPQGTNQYPYVSVLTYEDIPSTPIAAPTFTASVIDYLGESWRTIGMIAVGLVSLVMLRGMIRGAAPAPGPARADEAAEGPRLAVTEEDEEDEPAVESTLRRKFDASGPNLKQELQLLVKEDPDAAAAILRNWIGDAA
jgi:flagellar M-ring protein FliF